MSARAVVIGASAGALEALSGLLPRLPADYPLAVIIVVHVPANKKSILADLFREKCAIRVVEVEDKEPVQDATVYFAPPDYHLMVEREKYLALSNEEPVLYSRPSIDVLFESAADAYGSSLTAIVLSGANSDGALGMKAVIDAGGMAMIQRPGDAYAAAMPEAAIALCPTAQVLSLTEIAQSLLAFEKV